MSCTRSSNVSATTAAIISLIHPLTVALPATVAVASLASILVRYAVVVEVGRVWPALKIRGARVRVQSVGMRWCL